MSVNDQYALNWSNHTSHIRKAFDTLLSENQFVDVTLSCEGKKVVAHKIILSACSTYFHDLFRDNPCQHPIVILKDVKFQNLIDILKFIYNGEVSVSSDNFDSFLKTAELLQISGLTDDDSKQLEEASTTIESNETPTLETTSINLKSSPQPSQSTSIAATSTLTHRVKSPISKKRPIEILKSEEPPVQRKKRESGLDIEIKEEISESNFEEDELNSIIDIKDPLQLEQQHEESDLSETLPVEILSFHPAHIGEGTSDILTNQIVLNLTNHVRSLQDQLDKFAKSIINKNNTLNCDVDEIDEELFPIRSIEALNNLEENIRADIIWKNKLLKRLTRLGGRNPTKMARNISHFLFDDHLMQQFSWLGKSSKQAFCNYKEICKLIVSSVSYSYKGYNDYENSTFFKEYLKHAKSRINKKDVAVNSENKSKSKSGIPKPLNRINATSSYHLTSVVSTNRAPL